MGVFRNKIDLYSVELLLDQIEDRVGDILNELDTSEGDERDTVDVDTVRKLVRQLKDDLY